MVITLPVTTKLLVVASRTYILVLLLYFIISYLWQADDGAHLPEQVVLMNGRVFKSVESSCNTGSGDNAWQVCAKLIICNTNIYISILIIETRIIISY